MVRRACSSTSAAASIHSQSVFEPGAVVERAASEAVTVCYFDRVDAGSVESCDDPLDVGGRNAVADSVHAVTKGDVLDEDLAVAHLVASFCWAMRSAICIPADVMMSRLPAYAGR